MLVHLHKCPCICLNTNIFKVCLPASKCNAVLYVKKSENVWEKVLPNLYLRVSAQLPIELGSIFKNEKKVINRKIDEEPISQISNDC